MPHHTFECPLRWADMDLLGHVNNVTYLDYVSEAREALFAGLPAGRATVRRHRVEFVEPLVFRREPVLVDTWVTNVDEEGLTLASEVYDAPADDPVEGTERTVYLRASTLLAHRLADEELDLVEGLRGPAPTWRPLHDEDRPAADTYSVTVRRSDLDDRGEARAGVLLEYFQEARIRYLMRLHTRGEKWTEHVVARTDVDYHEPVAHRTEPYSAHSWIAHLGNRSFTVGSELRDGDRVLARAAVVMVTFDLETQATRPMTERQRARLEQELKA